ncbi:gas vesicle protein [Peterkaempfera bronchialis]|uniref:Gas vesicle protein n=1 Tax=Peterkaempfera bronchialis TaxID=2126346 RepID=A0A345SVZ0_9ACTN|nr:gas vesicle protein [Peterkaempfera bronchialis]AXI77895.1 gas vesicle protein [Peterkaempfera bronchialis]
MGQPPVWSGRSRYAPSGREGGRPESANLADILERVLDKGIVIAGDIRVNLLDIELLTIKIRLIVASVDRAREMGIDWWEHDPMLTSGQHDLSEENRRLRRRIGDLEAGRTASVTDRPDGLEPERELEREFEQEARQDREQQAEQRRHGEGAAP